MENELLKIKDEALEKIEACSSLKELNDIRVLYLGKKGPIQEAMKSMKNMDPDQRKTFGQTSNKVKQELSKAVEDKKEVLEHQAIIDKINSETIDLSLPSYNGGLTGVRELRKRLPHEEIVYFGDTGRVPYGSRSPETILQYARQDIAFLLSQNVKCIMAACGTVSSTYPAAEAARLPVPYLGVVDAAAREAAFATRNRRIGVIGTAATIRSRSYETLLRKLVPGVEITARPCPLFVPLVEAGYVDHSEEEKQQVTRLVIAQYLTEVRDAGVDTLILGCTHYPLLKTMIGEFMGQSVTLVDPAKTAAHHLERMLSERGLRAAQENEGQAHFYVSDVPDSFVQTADLFLGEYKGGPVEQIAIDKY